MIITYQNMPPSIRGLSVRKFDDGEECYTIILNSCLSREQQEQAYKHELFHIENNDFDSCEDLDVIERRAHEYSNNR